MIEGGMVKEIEPIVGSTNDEEHYEYYDKDRNSMLLYTELVIEIDELFSEKPLKSRLVNTKESKERYF